ncbi:MAG: hypothetical protein M1376_13565 [Planctomycetes bacterium]|nr:hypothetical protein [Planctomycetota bacterium]
MRRQIGALAFIVLLSLAGNSWASEFAEGFETYAAGTSVHGQGGWKGWNNVAAAGAPVSNRTAHGGRNSIEILGSSDLVHEFHLTSGKWTVTAYQYIPTGARGATYFILLNTYQDDGPYDWSVQTEFDMTAGIITPAIGATGSPAKIVYDQWVQIRLVIDLTANTFEESYNGTKIATGPWDTNAHGTLQAIDLFGNGASSVYYDDLKIDSGDTAGASSLPRPAYDSGWITTPQGSPSQLYTKILTHNLGGNADDYVVDLQRKVSGIVGPNLSNQGLGTEFYYSFLTASTVSISAPYSAVDLVTSVRLRIWVYDRTAETP